eukprot:2284389-Rhodomonas_salina.2
MATAARLAASPSESTQMCIRSEWGNEMIGEVLSSDVVTEAEKPNLLQVRGLTYPTAMVVSRNTKGAVSPTCPLCKKGDETLAHSLMHCPELMGARSGYHIPAVCWPVCAVPT